MYQTLIIGTVFFIFTGSLASQTLENPTKNDTTAIKSLDTLSQELISVFLDCQDCDNSFIRQQVDFVNYVRDPNLGQVHLFINSQGTGSGGRTFTLSFIGKGEYEGINNTLTFTTLQTNTRDEERKGLNSIIELGLVPYVAHTAMADKLVVTVSDIQVEQTPEEDSWNNWIFEIYFGINFDKETNKSALDLRYGLSADHITETWRIHLRPYFNYNQRNFIRDEEEIQSILHRNGFDGSAVRSINSHWSGGLFSTMISSTYGNINYGISLRPAIEYSFYPYKDALRKEVTLAYSAGFDKRSYLEETVFGQLAETLPSHALEFGVRIRQPWGSLRVELEGSQFLHDMSKNRLSFESDLSWRVYKGLSVNFRSEIDIVRDQLSLPKGNISLEDILLQQRQLATSYGVSVNFGVSYSFGSMYNSVVNTRL
ncbi:MAG: hypothetical protein WD431_24700 [Cyclobacteriaceae bacterium]